MLSHDPRNAFAKLYLGYLAKVHEKNLAKAVELMKDDILESDAEVSDPRLYLELGDALARLNRQDEVRNFIIIIYIFIIIITQLITRHNVNSSTK